jgi:hypothetical protein
MALSVMAKASFAYPVPGLSIFGRLRPPPGVEDGEDGFLGERLVREFADGALEVNGVGYVHAAPITI